MLIAGAPFVWFLRDGLGPDAVESHGLTALTRFAQDMAEIAGPALILLVVGGLIYPWRRRRAA